MYSHQINLLHDFLRFCAEFKQLTSDGDYLLTYYGLNTLLEIFIKDVILHLRGLCYFQPRYERLMRIKRYIYIMKPVDDEFQDAHFFFWFHYFDTVPFFAGKFHLNKSG